MPHIFSLFNERWLPVALDDGRREFLRLCDISQPVGDQRILRIDTGRPDSDISLTEFLIGMLAVAFAPKDQRDWRDRYRAPPSAAELEAAFAPFKQALVLDGDGPRFFQDLEPLEGGATPIEALFIDAPGDNTLKNNTDLFVKRGRTACLSRAGAAIALLTLQTSAPSGGAGHRTSLRGGGPLTTLVVPPVIEGVEPTLWQRLWFNVPSGLGASATDIKRVFPWLEPTRTSDPKNNGETTTPEHVHKAQAFFGMPRRIRLNFEPNTNRSPCDLLGIVDDVVVTSYVTRPWGTNYAGWSLGHPLSPYYKVKEQDQERLPLHLQSARVGYRQWLGLATDKHALRSPAAIIHEFRHTRVANLERPEERRGIRLLACGYALDNMKPLDFAEAQMPLIITGSAYGDAVVANIARSLIQAAEPAANQLVNSVKLALYGDARKTDGATSVLTAARARFWADTEEPFYELLQRAADAIMDADDVQAIDAVLIATTNSEWLKALKFHALAIFDDNASIEAADSAKIKNLIDGRKFLSLAFHGYGTNGATIFTALGQAQPARKSKRTAKGSKTA